jgi:ligand-binding sensor domain-containing protein
MDTPVVLIAASQGDLWAAGSHKGMAATARFDGNKWTRQTHPDLSWGIDYRAVYESREGAIWFGSANPIRERGHLGGALEFDGKSWTHHKPPDALYSIYGIGQTADNTLWFGGGALYRFGGDRGQSVPVPGELTTGYSEVVYTAPNKDLWVGHRRYGVFHHDGRTWRNYNVQDGLADNRIISILQVEDGSVWVATAKDSRFDGAAWTTYALPVELGNGRLRKSRKERFGSIDMVMDGFPVGCPATP